MQKIAAILFVLVSAPAALAVLGCDSELKQQEQAKQNAALGNEYYRAQNYTEAVKLFRLAAKQGHAGAQFGLGQAYHEGNGTPQNDAEAVKWYRQAAEQGHAEAQSELGYAHHRGIGVPQNDAEAVKWYRQAAEQGHAKAQNELGMRYAEGEGGVLENDAEAAKWYRKAAEQGYIHAQFNLGALYYKGEGVPKNYRESYVWISLAAANGHGIAAHLRDAFVGGKLLSPAELSAAQEEAVRRHTEIHGKD